MLLRSAEDLASILRIDPGLVQAASPTGLAVLRGVASSMAHNKLRGQILDVLLTELDELGHGQLARLLRNRRWGMTVDPIMYRLLLPSDKIRMYAKRNELDGEVMLKGAAVVGPVLSKTFPGAVATGAAAAGGLLAEGAAGNFRSELERREMFRQSLSEPMDHVE